MNKKQKVLVCPMCKSDDIFVKTGTKSSASKQGKLDSMVVEMNVCNNCGHQWFKRPKPVGKPASAKPPVFEKKKVDLKSVFDAPKGK